MKINIKIFITLSLLILTNQINSKDIPDNIYNVKEYITKTGKLNLITDQLQTLVDECSKTGGGYIYFPSGEYLTGTLTLKDNVFLDIAPGATIYGSTDMKDYPVTGKNRKSLIYSDGANNIGIIGKGVINGQGDTFWRDQKGPLIRPDRFLLFENSKNIFIEDIKLTNSPNWNLEVRLCDGVWIEGLSIINDRKSPNTDGIDPVSSKNVFISNCYIDTGDDGICPKSIGDIPNENLTVTNCIIISDDSAIKLGTRSETYIRDAVFSNIVIKNTDYGIAFYAKDGGVFENIRFSNIHIESTYGDNADSTKSSGTYPIFIDLERRNPKTPMGAVRNVVFSNISIDTQDGHCVFLGQPDSKLENIYLSDIQYTVNERRPYKDNYKPRGVKDLKDKAPNDFSHIESYFTFAHIDNLNIDKLTIQDLSDNPNYEKSMIWGYDVHSVVLSNFRNKQTIANKKLPLLYFKESSSVEIKSNSPAPSLSPFLHLEGKNSKNIVTHSNNLLNFNKLFSYSDDFATSELIDINNITN